tara:strand:+ start:2577 stop:2978 length:402 start_codon:yes stop_codon:yes gene_type:complete
MSTTTSEKKYAKYTPKMMTMIMNRFKNRSDSQTNLDVAKGLLEDFNRIYPKSSNIQLVTAGSIVQKHVREEKKKVAKRLHKRKLKTQQTLKATPTTVKSEPVSATLRGYAIQKVLKADNITITEVSGKLTITL